MDTQAVQSAGSTLSDRLFARLRWIAVRGLASAVAGIIVLGIGGRLVMFASRLVHPDAVGRFTENGNRIGEFTIGGTVELILFGGLLGGLMAGVVWVFVKEWIPDRPVLVGLGSLASGGFLLVEADNRDFDIVGDPRLDLVLLLGLLFSFGAALQWLDDRLESRLPSRPGVVSTVVYSLIASFGVLFIFPTLMSFLSEDFCFCESPPVWTGVFLVVAAVATLMWWVLDLRETETPPRVVRTFGQAAVAGAVLAGGIHLTGQILRIL